MKIYQIEVSNRCNLACSYCPHPRQLRPQGLMGREVFEQSVELLVRCGQRHAYLHNFGEPLLHPQLVSFVRHCVARGVVPSFFTNGVLVSAPALAALEEAGLRELYVSEHKRGEAERIQDLIDQHGLSVVIRGTFRPTRGSVHSWGGQVPAPAESALSVSSGSNPCLFERENAAVVLWDGRINVCCIDVEGRGFQGNVGDYLATPDRYRFQPISLCDACTLMRGEEDLS